MDLSVQLLGGEQRETVRANRKPRLRAEHGKRAGAGAVGLELAVFQDVPQQIEVLNHRGKNLTTKRTKEKKKFSRVRNGMHRSFVRIAICRNCFVAILHRNWSDFIRSFKTMLFSAKSAIAR